MKESKSGIHLSSNLWLNRNNSKFLGSERIKLLEKIDELGSITKAAKAVGICYKTAWDTVSAINNLAEKPLVGSLTGGKGGGGTTLTPEGKRVIAQFKAIQEQLRQFLENLEQSFEETENLYTFLRRNSIKLSARNIFFGIIKEIAKGVVNARVTLTLKGGITITSIITNDAADSLGLSVGKEAYAIVKASSVMVGIDLHTVKISANNMLPGTVARVVEGAVNTEVDVEIEGGTIISAIITHDSAVDLALKQGDNVCALFKASSVILGVN